MRGVVGAQNRPRQIATESEERSKVEEFGKRRTHTRGSCCCCSVVEVGGEVLREVVSPGEALATHLAVVGPLPGVDPQVPVHVALATERAATEFALEWPLARVLAHVQFQVFLRPAGTSHLHISFSY